jgi:DNA helicase-4
MKGAKAKGMDGSHAIIVALTGNPRGLYAREIASRLGISRKEVIRLLTAELRRQVTTDGYTWSLADASCKTVFQEIAMLLENEDWQGFDRAIVSKDLDSPLRDMLLECKASAIVSKLDETIRLDLDQARILASPARTIRVTARAGSGKTRLLTALTYFLIHECDYSLNEVLLLAFNRDAAGQIEDRLTKLLKIPAFPGARTFHSLAYGVAAPEQAILFDKGENMATRELSALVQDILVGLLDEELLDEVYDLFRCETAEAQSTGAFLQGEDAYDFRRALMQYTLGGQAVRSRGEKFIGDFLFEHGIAYFYESPTRWEGGWYRPDFTIMVGEGRRIVWEHWAVDPDASLVNGTSQWPEAKLREYQVIALRKREFWKSKDVPLLESCAQSCADREAFEAEVADKLRPFLPEFRRLPKGELIARMKKNPPEQTR